MNTQVTTVEQSQRLLDLGIPSEKASLVWTTVDDNETVVERDLCRPENIEEYAFTATDLFNLLPATIYDKDQEWHLFVHKISQSGYVIIYYEASHTNRYSYNTEGSYINALYDMIVKLITTGHKISI